MHSKRRHFLLLKEKHFQLNHKYLFKTTKKCSGPSKDSKTAETAARGVLVRRHCDMSNHHLIHGLLSRLLNTDLILIYSYILYMQCSTREQSWTGLNTPLARL